MWCWGVGILRNWALQNFLPASKKHRQYNRHTSLLELTRSLFIWPIPVIEEGKYSTRIDAMALVSFYQRAQNSKCTGTFPTPILESRAFHITLDFHLHAWVLLAWGKNIGWYFQEGFINSSNNDYLNLCGGILACIHWSLYFFSPQGRYTSSIKYFLFPWGRKWQEQKNMLHDGSMNNTYNVQRPQREWR